MTFKTSVVLLVLGCISLSIAQQFQTLLYRPNRPAVVRPLPYYPRPQTRALTLQRVRRAVVGGEVKTNPNGGNDVKVMLGEAVGSPLSHVSAGVLAAGNTKGGPVTTGGQLAYNLGNHQLSLTKTHTPGNRDIFTQNAKVNIFDNGNDRFDANVFKSKTDLANGFNFERTGGSLDWSNSNGHSAKVGVSSIPNFGKTYEVGGSANLWTSRDKSTTLDLYGTGTKTYGGPFDGKNNFGGGLSLTSLFG